MDLRLTVPATPVPDRSRPGAERTVPAITTAPERDTAQMTDVYRDEAGRQSVREWCLAMLDGWALTHVRETLETSAGRTHTLSVGAGAPRVVFLPGTNFNAATSLPLLAALAARWPTLAVDLPGQPGLSDGNRPAGRERPAWYGRWLTEVLGQAATGPVVLVGHSLGAAVALACDSPLVAGRVLLSPGGLTRLRVGSAVMEATIGWLLLPTAERSDRLLRLLSTPDQTPAPELVDWMTLVACSCRTSLAPPVLPAPVLASAAAQPLRLAVGAHDVFLPPGRLDRSVARLGAQLLTLPDAGHRLADERPEEVVKLVHEVYQELTGQA